MAIREVVTGDISGAWLLSLRDYNKVVIPPSAGVVCEMAVFDSQRQEVIQRRAITELTDDDRFLIYLVEAETLKLKAGGKYTLVVQMSVEIAGQKSIKREERREFTAVAGYLT